MYKASCSQCLAYISTHRTLHGEREKVIKFNVQSRDIIFLEHIVVYFTMQFTSFRRSNERGKFEVVITSPSGTRSTLLPLRPTDQDVNSFDDWPLMSVHFWGENPVGTWTITVRNTNTHSIFHPSRVHVRKVALYGTSRVPLAVSRIPKRCSLECDSTRGCAGPGMHYCDACAKLRIASTLQCVFSCPHGMRQRDGYCHDSKENHCAIRF